MNIFRFRFSSVTQIQKFNLGREFRAIFQILTKYKRKTMKHAIHNRIVNNKNGNNKVIFIS